MNYELSILALILFLGLAHLIWGLKQLNKTAKAVQKDLASIAESQRILANNPNSFEEKKKINALNQGLYD